MSLSATHISAGYKRKTVIHNVSVAAKPGELIALIGPNGSGKSTLIKALAGLLPISGGDIKLSKRLLTEISHRERAKILAYLAQDRTAQTDMTVAEIMELGRAPYRGRLGQISNKGRDAIAHAVQATGLEGFQDTQFGSLSGGEQARVLLARALCVDAPIILADEPIAALDPYYQINAMDILRSETARGKTLIVALHDLALARHYADQVWIMDQGHLKFAGDPAEALENTIIQEVFKVKLPEKGLEIARTVEPLKNRHKFVIKPLIIQKGPHICALLVKETRQIGDAGWSSPVARQAHNLKVVGSNPTPATNKKTPSNCWAFLFLNEASVWRSQNI